MKPTPASPRLVAQPAARLRQESTGWFAAKPDITFAPYGEHYASKPDFAQVEYELPDCAGANWSR
jgi:hypothetical protein